jgi:phosphate:Na+ symporter
VTLLAAYHTVYNVVGVLVLLPLIEPFTRFVERLLPERASPLTRCLDPAALATPIVAVEAVRRTVARSLGAVCAAVDAALTAPGRGGVSEKGATSVAQAAHALRQAREFISGVDGPPDSANEQRRLTSTLHALDHASRLAELAGEISEFGNAGLGPEDERAVKLCVEAMRSAASAAGEVAVLPSDAATSADGGSVSGPEPSAEKTLVSVEQSANALDELRRSHRTATLGAVASGTLTADEAMVRVDAVRRLEALAHHAWRAVAHLLERGEGRSVPTERHGVPGLGEAT